MLFVQGSRDAFGTADEIRALLPSLQHADAARGRQRRPFVQGVRPRGAEAGPGAGRHPRRGEELDFREGLGPAQLPTSKLQGTPGFRLPRRLPNSGDARSGERRATGSWRLSALRRLEVGSCELRRTDSAIAIVRQCACCSLPPTSPSLSRPPAPAIAPSFRTTLQVEPDDIFPDWDDWEPATNSSKQGIDRYAALKGTLSQGPDALLEAFRLSEELGQLAYRVWYFPSLRYDEDQRDNTINAKRQQVQILFARLEAGRVLVQPRAAAASRSRPCAAGWSRSSRCGSTGSPSRISTASRSTCSTRPGERLMSLASRLASAPNDAYWALSTADAKFPTITLSTGEEVTVSYGQYRALLATRREQADREAAFRALHETYQVDAQHLRHALQRRLPARLVPGARARLQEHARGGAARRQHPHVGRREPDRDDAGRRRAAAPLPPAAAQGARRAVVSGLRLLDPARHVRQEVSVRRRARLDRRPRSRRSAPTTRRGCARDSPGGGSTSTRTRASARARTRRRCTARTLTCC